MTLTSSTDEAPQWMFWLFIVGVFSAAVTPVALVLCVPMWAWIFTPPFAKTETH